MQRLTALARRLPLVSVACGLILAGPHLSEAAPDGTLGMALLSANVNSNGTLQSESGVTATANPGTGTYVITFDRDITNCTAVVDTDLNYHQAIQTADNQLTVTTLFQSALNSFTPIETDFKLIAYCPK